MSCLFCEIAAGRIPSAKVYEDEQVYAFRDIAPQAPVHVLLIPRRHIEGAHALTDADGALVNHLLAVSRLVAEQEGVEKTGYRLITNVGADAGQSVPHLHLHLLGGRALKWDN